MMEYFLSDPSDSMMQFALWDWLMFLHLCVCATLPQAVLAKIEIPNKFGHFDKCQHKKNCSDIYQIDLTLVEIYYT